MLIRVGLILITFLISGIVQAETCKRYKMLSFSIIPSSKLLSELDLYKPIVKEIENRLGVPVSLVRSSSYDDLLFKLLSGQVQVARIGPFSYVSAKKLDKNNTIEVFATHVNRRGTYKYHSLLIVNSSSPYMNYESLIGTEVLLSTPGSTSGSLVPMKLFNKEIGTPLKNFFKKITYSGGQDISINSIVNNTAVAAFVSQNRLDIMMEKGKLNQNDIRILWKSEPLPQDPFVYLNDMCSDYLSAIRETFLTIHEKYQGQIMLKKIGSKKFIKTDAEPYEIIMKLSKD